MRPGSLKTFPDQEPKTLQLEGIIKPKKTLKSSSPAFADRSYQSQVPCALSWDASLAQALKGITGNQESLDAEHFWKWHGTRYTFDSKSQLLVWVFFHHCQYPLYLLLLPMGQWLCVLFSLLSQNPHRSLFRASCSGIQWKEQEGLWRSWLHCRRDLYRSPFPLRASFPAC